MSGAGALGMFSTAAGIWPALASEMILECRKARHMHGEAPGEETTEVQSGARAVLQVAHWGAFKPAFQGASRGYVNRARGQSGENKLMGGSGASSLLDYN